MTREQSSLIFYFTQYCRVTMYAVLSVAHIPQIVFRQLCKLLHNTTPHYTTQHYNTTPTLHCTTHCTTHYNTTLCHTSFHYMISSHVSCQITSNNTSSNHSYTTHPNTILQTLQMKEQHINSCQKQGQAALRSLQGQQVFRNPIPSPHLHILHCTVLYCSVLHCTVLYCTVL